LPVIIPKEISKALHLKIGEYLDCKQVGDHVELFPVYLEKRRNNLNNYAGRIMPEEKTVYGKHCYVIQGICTHRTCSECAKLKLPDEE